MNFQTITKSTLDQHKNTIFKLHLTDTQVVDLTLLNIEENIQHPVHNILMILEGEKDTPVVDNIYKYTHEGLGTGEVFIKPHRETKDKIYYDIIISRFVEGFDPNL